MVQARITVLQVPVFRELVEKLLPKEVWEEVGPCEFFKLDQSFIIDACADMPAGFCPSAWFDLRDKFAACLRDEDPLTPMIVCCQDGLRPVTFRIERLES